MFCSAFTKVEDAKIIKDLYIALLEAQCENDYNRMIRIVVDNPIFSNLDLKIVNTFKQPNLELCNKDRNHVNFVNKLMQDLKIDMKCAEKYASPEWKQKMEKIFLNGRHHPTS